jgi:hypothetical protein
VAGWQDEEWLSSAEASAFVPQRGDKRRLVELAAANARHEEEAALVRKLARKDRSFEALRQLQRELAIPALPRRIECFDISNLGDRDLVGSSVSFAAAAKASALAAVPDTASVASVRLTVPSPSSARRTRAKAVAALKAAGAPRASVMISPSGSARRAAARSAPRASDGTEPER